MIESQRVHSTERRTHFNAADFLKGRSVKVADAVIWAGAEPVPVSLLEAIDHDIRITTDVPLMVGQEIPVSICPASLQAQPERTGVVHWCQAGDSGYSYGIALRQPLSAGFTVRQPNCQRSSLRYECRVAGTLYWQTPTAASTSAVAVNYSREGVCFQMRSVPAIGTKVRFVFELNTVNRAVDGYIRWVIGQNGTFLVGCELVDALGYVINGVVM